VNILVKSLIVWLMLVAIPFQGFASASMLLCAPIQAPTVEMAAADHDHHAMMMEHASAAPADGHDAANHHDGGKCNTCASCCFGATMAPGGLPRLPAEAPQLAAFHFEPGHVARVDLALPERPPQTSLI
jgi:hypothetical protein